MTLTMRKMLVLGIVGTILLLGNILFVATWLAEKGIVDWARYVRAEYFTGTAVTIIAVLLVLLITPRTKAAGWVRRCPVCDERLIGNPQYCGECGSRVKS